MTPRHFAWQAWHLMTSTVVSRGRRGIFSHSPWFCVAGVALMALGGGLGPVLVARVAAATHTICHTPSFTQTLLTHHLSYNLCQQFSDAHLCHTPSVTDHLSHTLCHIPTFTHNFVEHRFSHTHTHLCHTPSVTDHFSRTLCHIPLMLIIGRS